MSTHDVLHLELLDLIGGPAALIDPEATVGPGAVYARNGSMEQVATVVAMSISNTTALLRVETVLNGLLESASYTTVETEKVTAWPLLGRVELEESGYTTAIGLAIETARLTTSEADPSELTA